MEMNYLNTHVNSYLPRQLPVKKELIWKYFLNNNIHLTGLGPSVSPEKFWNKLRA